MGQKVEPCLFEVMTEFFIFNFMILELSVVFHNFFLDNFHDEQVFIGFTIWQNVCPPRDPLKSSDSNQFLPYLTTVCGA